MKYAAENNCRLLLPLDKGVGPVFEPDAPRTDKDIADIAPDDVIIDGGPKTAQRDVEEIGRAAMVIWNGTVGMAEWMPTWSHGSFAIARAIAENTRNGKLKSIVGGGDTVAALDACGVMNDITYVSTGGGAFLEFIEGRELPGIRVLEQ
jgi:phosphoglycerate kinase